MLLISMDVEADGPVPGLYSMVSFGAVVVEPSLSRTFLGQTAPISNIWRPSALAVSRISREEHTKFPLADDVIKQFVEWLRSLGDTHLVFIADNNGFDWQFMNYYLWRFTNSNPFGHSSRRIGDLYCGMKMNMRLIHEWKKRLRKTKHTHNPVDDAKGNAEALLAMLDMGLSVK